MAAVARDGFEVLVACVTAGCFLGFALGQAIQEPAVELLVNLAGLRWSDPMRKAASA